MRPLALGLVGLYPEAWRERYGDELRELLAGQEVGPRAVVDLARGCADAHLHPSGLVRRPREQMRGTIGSALCCWIGFVICGTGFAKLTEDHAFGAAAAGHPLIGVTRTAIALFAVASAAAVVLGGGRLICEVVGEAVIERRRSLVAAVCAPFAAVVAFGGATAAVAGLASGGVAAHTDLAWGVFLAWCAIGLAGATVCGLASRAALRLADPRPAALRDGVFGAVAVTGTLGLMTCLTCAYTAALAFDAPSLAAEANGPLGLVSTTGGLVILVILMAGLTGLAGLTTARGLRAVGSAVRRP